MLITLDVDTLLSDGQGTHFGPEWSRRWIGNSYIDGQTWLLYTDYGTYGYHWHSIGDQSLKSFICSCDVHYLVKKLIPQEELREVDWDETKKSLIKYILEQRREKEISQEEARDYYDNLKYIEHEQEYAHSSYPVDDWWEEIQYKPTNTYKSWTELVLPGFQKLFRDQVTKAHRDWTVREFTT